MNSLFHREAESEPDSKMPQVWGWSVGIVVFCLSFANICLSVSHSRSSTAAIGYIWAPFISAIIAVPSFAAGWCTGYFLTWRRSPNQRRRRSAFAAGLCCVIVASWIVNSVWSGTQLEQEVLRIQAMNSAELEAVMMNPRLARNKFVLSAVAENPNASALVLHRIAVTDLPELYERMSSAFAVLGKNDRGLAVMRLVARHPNTAAVDVEILAKSKVDSVLDDVATNPKLSEATIRRLASDGHYFVQTGLARNLKTPQDVLSALALSADEYTRAGVAANTSTPPAVLAGLGVDQVWHVRRSVAMNPDTPGDVVEKLTHDADARVSREAMRTVPEVSER